MRITQQLAKDISKSMLAKKNEKLAELRKNISETTREEILKDVPEKVLYFYEEYPNFVATTSYVYLNGNGCNRECVSIKPIPHKGGTLHKDVTPEFGAVITKLINKESKLRNEIYDLGKSIENALIQLRTFKNVRASFPEAAQYLPPDDKPLLPALNLDIIRQQLH